MKGIFALGFVALFATLLPQVAPQDNPLFKGLNEGQWLQLLYTFGGEFRRLTGLYEIMKSISVERSLSELDIIYGEILNAVKELANNLRGEAENDNKALLGDVINNLERILATVDEFASSTDREVLVTLKAEKHDLFEEVANTFRTIITDDEFRRSEVVGTIYTLEALIDEAQQRKLDETATAGGAPTA
ncbi:uncharacterized protein LOC112049563 [Bicyclus anynana]|uniref:Uncharacterized protein LOC112049563 n=1 Tax=Bicyclus anynana TaxID=110368 RepID=A0A6J1NE67_BICAN|nr:uncharacterized protein LOC112049563 [Bicyclus anynana]